MALPCDNLNLNLYRVFYIVAKTKSFSESSKVLHISQPAISKHVQNLEYELDTLLFYRTNRGIELTPEAKSLYAYVEKAYNYLMLGERELQEGKDLTKGTISIGILTYLNIISLNNSIKKFMESNPNIKIKLTNHDESILLNLFEQHSLDLLIIPERKVNNKELKYVELEDDEYCFAACSYFLNVENLNTIEELIKKPLLLPTKNTNQRKKLDEYLNTKGLVANPVMELETSEMIINYINENLGIGYIPKKVAEKNNNIKIINLQETLPIEKNIIIYNNSTLNSSSRKFIELLNDTKA